MGKAKIHQVMLEKVSEDTDFEMIAFRTIKDHDIYEVYKMNFASWEYLGRPDQITIHVFPGDVRHHFPVK